MTAAYIGLGSNQGEPQAQLARAFDEIAALPGTRLTGRSPLYRSAPVDAPRQPDFINAVAAVVFVLVARIDWGVAGLIALGAVAGGQIGATVGRRLPDRLLRAVIVVVGVTAILVFLLR